MSDPARVDRHLASVAGRRFVTFRISGRHYALPGDSVAEVIMVPRVARLPHSPRSLLGLANLRGTVIPVVDPRAMLGEEAFTPGGAARAIVLAGANQIALAVDAVDRFVFVDDDGVETTRPELAANPGEILLGTFQIGTGQIGTGQTGTGQTGTGQVTKILDLPAMLGVAFGDRRARDHQPRANAVSDTRVAANTATADQRLLISFEVAGQDYALALDAIREIIPFPSSISIVPRAEAVLLGVAPWRDALLPLLSLRGLLGLESPAAWTGAEKVLVTIVNGAPVGLVADRARALIRADASAIDPAPGMLSARSGGESKITAIYRADGGRRLISLLAPELLFREDVMRRLGDSVTATVAPDTQSIPGATMQFVIFRLGVEEFGLPIGAVDEVALVPERMTRVPKMPKFLEGVINLRGDVLPVVDQRRRFDMPAYSGRGRRRLIVVRADRHRAGLIVDSVSEVLRAPVEAIEQPPDLTGEGDRLITGVINTPLTGRMILLLDPGELLTRAEHGVLDKLDFPGNPEVAGNLGGL